MLALARIVAPGPRPLQFSGETEIVVDGGVVQYYRDGALYMTLCHPFPIATHHSFDAMQYLALIAETGTLYTAGDNREGALCLEERALIPEPVEVTLPHSAPVCEVYLSRHGSSIVTETGLEYWCRPHTGTTALTGTPITYRMQLRALLPPRAGWHTAVLPDQRTLGSSLYRPFAQYTLDEDIITLAGTTTPSFVCAVTVSGTLYYLGAVVQVAGESGHGHEHPGRATPPPTLNKAILPAAVRHIACGRLHVLALLTDGSVYACGNNHHAQLGTGDPWVRRRFVRVRLAQPVTELWAVDDASFFRFEDGTIHGTGFLHDAPLVGGYYVLPVDDTYLPRGLRR